MWLLLVRPEVVPVELIDAKGHTFTSNMSCNYSCRALVTFFLDQSLRLNLAMLTYK